MDERILDDDGDPDWTDEEDYDTEFPFVRLPDRRVVASWPGSEIFVDIPHPSRYRMGQILRVKTSTVSGLRHKLRSDTSPSRRSNIVMLRQSSRIMIGIAGRTLCLLGSERTCVYLG